MVDGNLVFCFLIDKRFEDLAIDGGDRLADGFARS